MMQSQEPSSCYRPMFLWSTWRALVKTDSTVVSAVFSQRTCSEMTFLSPLLLYCFRSMLSAEGGGGGASSVSKEMGIQGFTLQPLCYATGLLPWQCSGGWLEGRGGEGSSLCLRATCPLNVQIWTSMHRRWTDIVESDALQGRVRSEGRASNTRSGWGAVTCPSAAWSSAAAGLRRCIMLFLKSPPGWIKQCF